MVATHMWDLTGAAKCGLKTIYIRRAAEEPMSEDEVKSKADGGEVDIVVDSFVELADILSKQSI